MLELYENCTCCPHHCNINRFKTLGFCKSSEKVKIARAALYFYEEPAISGTNGSGTIFLVGVIFNVFIVKTKEISTEGFGKEITITKLAKIMLMLQEKNAHNINLVTPTHFIPSIIEAIKIAKENGLKIPIVYNSSGYEDIEMLKKLKSYIDIYLVDFKYYDNNIAKKLSHIANYQEMAKIAIKEMVNQTGVNKFDDKQIMLKGVIVRHLCLPTLKKDSKKILHYLYTTYGNKIYLSVMSQYTPLDKYSDFPFLNQPLSEQDYDEIIDYALDLGIKNAYMQEGKTCDESFIPTFDLSGV